MERIVDYLILFFCSTILLLSTYNDTNAIVPICIAISFTCFSIYFDSFFIVFIIYIAFCALSIVIPSLMFFSPLILYKFFNQIYIYVCLLYGFVFFYNYSELNIVKLVAIIAVIILAYLLKYRTDKFTDEKERFQIIREKLNDYNTNLNLKNNELLEKQDYEITNATLNERNRIAREIHDSVGHILSCSILQIAALSSITKDESTKSYLDNINKTLTDGMNSIRSSIHNIHDDSINLNMKLKELVDGFEFCAINYSYDIDDDFTAKAKYAIIYVVKESLTNIMKHSNSTLVKISISQNPAFYKIDINDNGTNIVNNNKNQGMGTISIYDRISALNGTINITKNNGYRIYITIPVKRKDKENG